jgi:hypothetical protein
VPGVHLFQQAPRAILGMASRLGGFEALSEDPLVEVDVEKDTLDIKLMMQEIEECIVLEEDSVMYAMAGIELVPVPAPLPVQARIESNQAGHGFCAYCEMEPL